MSQSETEKKAKLPSKWQAANKAIKATQVAFDMDERIQYEIRRQALEDGVSPSDQIRHILGLPCTRRPKRPRLTVSLSPDDYELLGQKYGIDPAKQLEIKKIVVAELTEFAQDKN
ncbi:hypothetical protein [Psychrobium sp. 1_MG-2023]|uniref:hypothetical protein n=1 Tax=Psychrobium sp. 1_MG-2023 TaxID=3062624 RepID=UPI000C31F686|nr:hypothetical protein [Psychrobium sp. 1_MG-2023]MDP2562241.1 hypothetical protein [Psychrobium sp. 1_MG-2023]PKF57493.1 hypothetical protein CW748_06260 [Alteromonadales bacterium alter-6D02]